VRSIDEEFAEFDRPDVPGLVLMVIENGKASIVRSYGLANLETRAPCQPETNFRLASVTKAFTAMAVMILVEKGALSLDDKLPLFFSGFLPCGHDIKIRHLLTHTSGLLDYEEWIPRGTTAQLHDRGVLEILRRQNKTHFPPGARFRYSNGGYALLALIVEAASGLGFAAYLRREIFQPLEMNNTVAWEDGVSEVPHRALGYSKKAGVFDQTDQDLTSAVLGDGGVYSSVNDLLKWDQALYTEKLVSGAMLSQAFTTHSSSSDMPGSGYGFGWHVEGRGAETRVWHHGSTCGFSSSFHRFPERKWSVILMANRRQAGLEAIMRKVAR
jgi:CubicO group peptidase (beta-lactamase class C family)